MKSRKGVSHKFRLDKSEFVVTIVHRSDDEIIDDYVGKVESMDEVLKLVKEYPNSTHYVCELNPDGFYYHWTIECNTKSDSQSSQ